MDLFLRGNNFSGCIPFTLYRTLFHDLWQLNRPACPAPDTLTTSTDRAALVALYNATSGASWTNNSNWLSDNPIYTWRGVTVDGNGRVTRLSLPSNGLSGSLPVKVGWSSPSWPGWDLNGNSLTGTIPSELGSLTRLSSLYLNDNQLSGSLPSQLGLLMEAKLRRPARKQPERLAPLRTAHHDESRRAGPQRQQLHRQLSHVSDLH